MQKRVFRERIQLRFFRVKSAKFLRFFVHGTVHGPAHPRGQPERLQRHGREQKGGGHTWEKVHADTRDRGRQRALPAKHDSEQGVGEQRHHVPAADVHRRGARPRKRLSPSLPHHGPILGQLSGILARLHSPGSTNGINPRVATALTDHPTRWTHPPTSSRSLEFS